MSGADRADAMRDTGVALAAHGPDADALYDAICDCGNLTRRQLLIWAGDHVAGGRPVFVEVGLFHLDGVVDVSRFQRAWRAVAEETDALRLAIEDVDGWPRQWVRSAPSGEVEVLDLASARSPLSTLDELLRERAEARIARSGALVDATLVRLGPRHWVWALAQHQLVSDAWSFRLVYERMSERYRHLRTDEVGTPRTVPQFQDYVAYERRLRASSRSDEARAYWRACYPAPDGSAGVLAADPLRHATRVHRTRRPIGVAATAALRARAATIAGGDLGVFALVASLAAAYVHRHTAAHEVVLSVPFTNRPSARFKDTAGSFMNVCPVRIGIESGDTLALLAARLACAVLEAATHQQYAGRPGAAPQPYDVLVNVQKRAVAASRFDDMPMQVAWLAPTHRFGALAIAVEDFGATGDLAMVVDANVEQFGIGGSAAVADELRRLLDGFLDDPTRRIGHAASPLGPPPSCGGEGDDRERVQEWQQLWDDTYQRETFRVMPADFNTVGWSSRYTRQPIPDTDMREWVAATTDRILALAPKHVLEIGCGSGMLLCRLAPGCGRYVASDLSAAAIDYVRGTHLAAGRWGHVELRHAAAHDFTGIRGPFDTVVLNSVVQYFPSAEYLWGVLREACEVLGDAGAVFVGDVRHLGLARALYASVEIARMPRSATVAELRARVAQAAARESELLVDPAFFAALARERPEATSVDVQLKRGRLHNELTRFRYDVAWRKGFGPPVDPASLDWSADGLELAAVARLVRMSGVDGLAIRGVPNARLRAERRLMDRLDAADPGKTVGALGDAVAAEPVDDGVDPEDFWGLASPGRWNVHVAWSALGWDRYDVIVRPVAPRAAAIRGVAGMGGPDVCTPTPHEALGRGGLTNAPRSRRNADGPYGPAPEFADLEHAVGMLWSAMLGVDAIGRDQSFFELGGDSLLVYRMLARLRSELGHEVPVDRFLERPTVAGLVATVLIGGFDGIDAAEIERALLEVEALSSEEAAALLQATDVAAGSERE